MVADAVRAAGHECEWMEDWGASAAPPEAECLARIRRCGGFILLIGSRYGASVPGTALSFTEMEYGWAMGAGLRPWVYRLTVEPAREGDTLGRRRLQRFRNRLERAHKIRTFSTVSELRDRVEADLEKAWDQPRQSARGDAQPGAPYRGLDFFSEAEAGWFFGRDRECEALHSMLERRRLVFLTAGSGLGKSSLVRAGLIPLLDPDIRVVTVRPGRDAWGAVERAVGRDQHRSTSSPGGPGAGSPLLDLLLPSAAGAQRVLLFVDQFEEVFTQGLSAVPDRPEVADSSGFCAALAEAVRADPRVMILAAVRADFLKECSEVPAFAREMQEALLWLEPLDRRSLREVICRPAWAAGLRFDDKELVDDLVEEVAGGRGTLPLLQFTLQELWKVRCDDVLTREAYERLGKVEGAVRQYADDKLEQLDPAQRTVARAVFLRLVDPRRDVRRPASRGELEGLDRRLAPGVIAHFVDHRLLSVHQDRVELAHEALVEYWGTLKGWREERWEALPVEHEIARAFRQWTDGKETSAFLMTGPRLRRAGSLLRAGLLQPGEDERPFLELSLRRARRRAGLVWSAVAVGLIFLVSAVWIAQIRNARTREVERARLQERARSEFALGRHDKAALSAAGALARGGDPGQSLGLALHPGAQLPARILRGHGENVTALAFSPDGRLLATGSPDRMLRLWDPRTGELSAVLEFGGHVKALAFAPGGETVVVGTNRGGLHRVELGPAGPESHEMAAGAEIRHLAFQPAASTFAVARVDGPVEVYNLDSRRREQQIDVRSLRGGCPDGTRSKGGAELVALSRDGRHLVASNSKSVVLLDREAGQGDDSPKKLWCLDSKVHSLELLVEESDSIAGQVIMVGLGAGTRAWDIGGEELWSPHPSRSTRDLRSVPIDASGRRVLTWARIWYSGAVLRLWERTEQPIPRGAPADEPAHNIPPVFAARDLLLAGGLELGRAPTKGGCLAVGGHLVAACSGREVYVWDLDAVDHALVFRAPSGATSIKSLAFVGSADGGLLLTGGRRSAAFTNGDNGLVLWRLHRGGGSEEGIAAMAGTVGEHCPYPPGDLPHAVAIGAVDVDPVSGRIATGDWDGGVRLWNPWDEEVLMSPARLCSLVPHTLGEFGQRIRSLDVSADGAVLATGDRTAALRTWSLDGPGSPQPGCTSELENTVMDLAFSPSGKWIATATERDRLVRLWGGFPEAGRTVGQCPEPLRLEGHTERVWSVAFSPDSELVASGSDDQTIRLWTVPGGTPAQPHVLRGHEDRIWALAFDPQRDCLLASSSIDKTVRLWDVCQGTLLATLFGHEHEVTDLAFSEDSWLASADASGLVLVHPPELIDALVKPQAAALEALVSDYEDRFMLRLEDDRIVPVEREVRGWSAHLAAPVAREPATVPGR